MKKLLLILAIIFLFSCSEKNDIVPSCEENNTIKLSLINSTEINYIITVKIWNEEDIPPTDNDPFAFVETSTPYYSDSLEVKEKLNIDLNDIPSGMLILKKYRKSDLLEVGSVHIVMNACDEGKFIL
jgi:hypothetical protein